MRRPTVCGQLFLGITLHRESKINNLHLIHLIDQDVVELKVSVHDGLGVHEGYALHYLREDFANVIFWQTWLLGLVGLLYEVMEALAFAELHYQVDMASGIDDFMQRHYVLVVEDGECVDLPPQGSRRLCVLKVLLFIDFQGNLMACTLMNSSLYLCKSTLPYEKLDLKVIRLKHLLLWFQMRQIDSVFVSGVRTLQLSLLFRLLLILFELVVLDQIQKHLFSFEHGGALRSTSFDRGRSLRMVLSHWIIDLQIT